MKYDRLIEKLAHYYTSQDYALEVRRAKKDFSLRIGLIEGGNEIYDEQADQFLDWFLFSRCINGTGLSPIEDARINKNLNLDGSDLEQLKNISHFEYSLFQFLKLTESGMLIRDLFSGGKIIISHSDMIWAFNTDEFFQVRIIPDEKTYCLTRGLCFHPVEAKKIILNEIKKVKLNNQEDRERFLFLLLNRRYKMELYKHLQPEVIYSESERHPKIK